MIDPEQILNSVNLDPTTLGDVFDFPLTIQEEFMLNAIDEALMKRANVLLDRALAGNAEIMMTEDDKRYILELTRIRKAVRKVLVERGSLMTGGDCLN